MRLLVLLRGINVGGWHIVPMADLRAVFEALGCAEVATYIQSGNLVCTTPAALGSLAIAAALEARFGFPIPVVLRSLPELAGVVAADPFADSPNAHTVFFERAPELAVLQALHAKCAGQEQLTERGRELFLDLPHGVGRSKLALACVAPSVPGNPTMRNRKTVLRLHAMLQP